MHTHNYKTNLTWTGNKGSGTNNYRAYERSHEIKIENKPMLNGSSDAAFRGDKTKYNPEELLVASLSACHMLAYLHVCAGEGVIVTGYSDAATGTMQETEDGGGHFTEVMLHPVVFVKDETMIDKANELHHKAHERCFIARSCNFPVLNSATCFVDNNAE